MLDMNETVLQSEDILFLDDDYTEHDFNDEQYLDVEDESWKIMVVDDENDIHTITRMALEGFSFEKRGISFLNAYSGEQARELINEHSDISVILLDVVMENEHAGLDFIQYLRNVANNKFTRIILRTGRPGDAPETKVITEYDINDYKEKNELTFQKLYTSVLTALRSYRDIITIEQNRMGLELIINQSSKLFQFQTLNQFTKSVLKQLISMLQLNDNSLYVQAAGFTASGENITILAATGEFENYIGKTAIEVLPSEIIKDIETAMREKKSFFNGSSYIGYFPVEKGSINMVYLEGFKQLTDIQKNLIRIFSINVAIAFENVYLNKEILDTQKELIVMLGEVVECRSKETANHVRRVAEFSYLLASKYGLPEEIAEILRIVSPMHDIGKIGIPDSILLKPGKLSFNEFQQMTQHTNIGHKIMKKSGRELMETAAIIALQHHERWDGNGYPERIKEDEIHIFSRITALADVFDALSHKRIYKEAWTNEEVIKFIQQQSGYHFDPKLVDIFLNNADEFFLINRIYPDESLPN